MPTFTVEGMSCGHCEQIVEKALQNMRGVGDSSADRESEQAAVEGDADASAIVQTVKDAGYTARV